MTRIARATQYSAACQAHIRCTLNWTAAGREAGRQGGREGWRMRGREQGEVREHEGGTARGQEGKEEASGGGAE